MTRQVFAGVHADTLAGRRLGVEATPTLPINRYQLLDTLAKYVRRALNDGDRAN